MIPFGKPGIGNSIPVPGDYDGSGMTELAVYVRSAGVIIYRPTDGGPDVTIPFGAAGVGATLPALGDYDGSGKTEVAAYLPAYGIFAYRPAAGGPDVYRSIGVPGAGQTFPVAPVATEAVAAFSAYGSGQSNLTPGVLGDPDALDFVFEPSTTLKKSKPDDLTVVR